MECGNLQVGSGFCGIAARGHIPLLYPGIVSPPFWIYSNLSE